MTFFCLHFTMVFLVHTTINSNIKYIYSILQHQKDGTFKMWILGRNHENSRTAQYIQTFEQEKFVGLLNADLILEGVLDQPINYHSLREKMAIWVIVNEEIYLHTLIKYSWFIKIGLGLLVFFEQMSSLILLCVHLYNMYN